MNTKKSITTAFLMLLSLASASFADFTPGKVSGLFGGGIRISATGTKVVLWSSPLPIPAYNQYNWESGLYIDMTGTDAKQFFNLITMSKNNSNLKIDIYYTEQNYLINLLPGVSAFKVIRIDLYE